MPTATIDRGIRRWSLFVLAAALTCLPAKAQTIVDGFYLAQISFAADSTGNVPCSEYGRAGFALRATPGVVQYAQVMAQLTGSSAGPAWIVQNVPLVPSFNTEQAAVDLTLLGISRGTCVNGVKLNYTITVTDNVIRTAPAYSGSSAAVVEQMTDADDGIDVTGATVTPGLSPPSSGTQVNALQAANFLPRGVLARLTIEKPPGDLNVQITDRPGMGNVIQKKNECAPGGVVNSMYWLQSQGSIDLKGDTKAQSMTKVEADMSWTSATGVAPINFVKGKLLFSQRAEHPLPLNIHYAASDAFLKQYKFAPLNSSVAAGSGTASRDGGDTPPTFDYIKQQMALGQDVELMIFWTGTNSDGKTGIRGGHVVTVTGVATGPDASGFFFSDDAAQDGKGTNQRNNMWVPQGTEQNTRLNASFMTLGPRPSEIVGVVSESPVEKKYLTAPQENSGKVGVSSLNLTMRAGVTTAPGQFFGGLASGLTPVPGSPFTAGSQAVAAATALQKYVYVTNFGANNVSGFSIDSGTGALTALTGSPFAAGANPFSIATDSRGLYAYVANFGGASISAYSIDPSTGALRAVAGSPFPTGAGPTWVTVSPSGRLLFATNSAGVSVYTIDPLTGGLTPVPLSPFAAGDTPYSVAADPNGRYVYVANAGSLGASSVSVFSIGQNGALTAVPGSPFSAGQAPKAIATDPSGQFVYTANYNSNNVSAFLVNPATGALTSIPGSPYSVDPGPFGIAVDPEGEFAYVASQANANGTIAAFAIDPVTGALIPVIGSPFAGGAGPARLTVMAIVPNAGVSNSTPVISQVAPSAAMTGLASAAITVWGSNFVPGAVARWNGFPRNTEFISSNELIWGASVGDLAAGASGAITVTNPTPGGGTSTGAPFTVSASISIPAVPGDATVNDAGFTAGTGVSPGSIAASFGTGLSNATVTFNGSLPAFVFGSVDSQINSQIPWELAGQRYGFATFTNGSGTSAPATVLISGTAPGIFTLNPAGLGAIVNNSTGVVTAAPGTIPGLTSQAVHVGDYIAIFCTGLGPVSNQPASGAPASSDPNNLSYTAATPVIKIGGVNATQFFSGLAPGFIGLYQIVVQVPAGVTPDNAAKVVVTINGVDSNTVTMAVQ